jgi:hypothetical protein
MGDVLLNGRKATGWELAAAGDGRRWPGRWRQLWRLLGPQRGRCPWHPCFDPDCREHADARPERPGPVTDVSWEFG